MDCVDVCPVDCFYEGENMLVIHPDECIDCGVCEPECPVDAIKPDTEPGLEKWLSLNAEYAKIWPNITVRKAPPPDFKEWEGKPDKLQYFSPNPGAGDCGGQRPRRAGREIGQLIQPGAAAEHQVRLRLSIVFAKLDAGQLTCNNRMGRAFCISARRTSISSRCAIIIHEAAIFCPWCIRQS